MKLTVINGNRDEIENRLIEKIQNGEDYQSELARMRPKGQLSLIRTASNSEYDWLVLDEIADL